MASFASLIAFSDVSLLMIVIGMYVMLAALWVIYDYYQRKSNRSIGRTNEKDPKPPKSKRSSKSHRAPAYRDNVETEVSSEPSVAVEVEPALEPTVATAQSSDDVNELKQRVAELQTQLEQSEEQICVLVEAVERIRFYIRHQEEMAAVEETVDEEASGAVLSIYAPLQEKYASDDTVADPDLGVVLTKAPKQADDLTRIWGIGAVNQDLLNQYGIYYFDQIADWNDHNVEQFNEILSFKGRIEREEWVQQAKNIVDGRQSKAA